MLPEGCNVPKIISCLSVLCSGAGNTPTQISSSIFFFFNIALITLGILVIVTLNNHPAEKIIQARVLEIKIFSQQYGSQNVWFLK